MCRAENTLKCKDFRAEGQTRKGVVYTDGKMLPPPTHTPVLTLAGARPPHGAGARAFAGRVFAV